VLVATSGDTGSAVAQAFRSVASVRVVVLYPAGRVSGLQEKQLTTVGGNVTALRVRGSFDDCQRMVKAAFTDEELSREAALTSANSINVGRFLPQSFYYVYAWAASREYGPAGDPVFVVPSGNLGNLCSGLYAWRWGMPVRAFVAATNANDVLPEYLASGLFRPRASVRTLSNAMDVGDPSNMERILDLFGHDVSQARSILDAATATDEQTLAAIHEVYERYGYLMDPHTAVGWSTAARRLQRAAGPGEPIILVSTAHPAKFPEVVREAVGIDPTLPPSLREAATRTGTWVDIGNTDEDLRAYLLG
jgi:threonine synthase